MLQCFKVTSEASSLALTSSVLEAEVGEPPDIAEPHSVGDTREDEVPLAGPGAALLLLLFLTALAVFARLAPAHRPVEQRQEILLYDHAGGGAGLY